MSGFGDKGRKVLAYLEENPAASIYAVAKYCGCSVSYVSDIRAGKKGVRSSLERRDEKRALWAQFASAALLRLDARWAASEADTMLAEYEKRWGSA